MALIQSAVVSAGVSAAVSACEQEVRQRWPSFDEDRRKLEATLANRWILIDRAETWSFKDTRLSLLLTELKNAAYDAKDLLADIEYEDQQRRIQCLHSLVSQLLYTLLNFVCNLTYGTAKRVRTIQRTLDMTADNLKGLMDQLGLHGDYSMPANRQMSSVVKKDKKVYGRDKDREKVIELLGIQLGQGNNGTDINESVSDPAKRSKKENVSVLSIYGIGGVGKTTLAQIVYNDQRVADHFDLKIWICVSDNFDVESLSKEIIDKAEKEILSKQIIDNAEMDSSSKKIIDNGRKVFKTDLMDLDSLQVHLTKIAMENRFLVILDDVWNEDGGQWEKFYAPLTYGKEGSMILVTTRTEKVASIVGTVATIPLEGLSGNVYWELFKDCAFGLQNPKNYLQLENIGRNIAAKLKGSPLAAKTLGNLLKDNMDEGYWTTVLNSELWKLSQGEGDILPALRLSYQYLLPHLKRCFSFCSIFPKDYQFDKNELVSIWVAEGFVISQGNMLLEDILEDIATGYLRDLTSRCFFQQSHRDPLNYVMHDLMHDLAQSVSVDECSRIDKGDGQLRIPKTVRHLSICCADIEVNMLKELGSYHKLRSLIILYNLRVGLDSVIDSWFRSLSNIRCLKLSFFDASMLPESISNLKHLRYLDVSGTSIRTLPESLCHLNNLQVLNVSNSWFECFPQGFTRLHNLRKLYAEEEIFSKISKIGELTSLQYLPQFEVQEDDQHKIGELKHMAQLRGSLCINKLENVGSKEDARQAKLDNKPYLDKLILEWSNRGSNFDHDMEVLEGLQPHQNLKKLVIRHYGGTTSPSWLRPQTLNCLSKLRIENCSGFIEIPCLPLSLTSLVLHDVGLNSLPRLWDECQDSTNESKTQQGSDSSSSSSSRSNRSSSLRIISISYCWKLTSLEGWLLPHYLPSLEKFTLVNCESLNSLPLDRFKDFVSLKSMLIEDCPMLTCRKELILPPSINDVHLENCGDLDRSLPGCLQNLKSLTSLTIDLCRHVTSLPGQVMCQLKSLEKLSIRSCGELGSLGGLDALASLKVIIILECPKLADSEPPMSDFNDEVQRAEISLVIDSITLLKLQSFRNLAPFITKLTIQGSSEPEMFVGEDRELLWRFKSLRNLTLWFCNKLNSLPTELHRLTSLQELGIKDCFKIHSLPENGLPASLTKLDFYGCNEEFKRQLQKYKSEKNL